MLVRRSRELARCWPVFDPIIVPGVILDVSAEFDKRDSSFRVPYGVAFLRVQLRENTTCILRTGVRDHSSYKRQNPYVHTAIMSVKVNNCW